MRPAAGPSHLRGLLGLSLAANAALAAGLWHKTADTRAHYWARATATAAPTPAPSALAATALADPPPSAMPDLAGELAAVRPAHAWAGQRGAAFAAWRAGLVTALDAALGGTAPPAVVEERLVARTRFPAVTREKRFLRLADGTWLPAYLLLPRAPQPGLPAVVALPGHDAPQAAWGRGAADVADAAKPGSYLGGFGMKLAEAGHVVLAVDVAGIGELAYQDYGALAKRGLLAGEPLAGRMTAQARAALGWLAARPEVADRPVGLAGLSLGGMLAVYAAVLDPRAAFAADAGFFLSYRDLTGPAALAGFVPGILRVADLPDVAGALAPRPLLVQADPHDRIATATDLEGDARRTAAIYAAAGAPAAFTFQRHARGHALDAAGAAAWLATQGAR